MAFKMKGFPQIQGKQSKETKSEDEKATTESAVATADPDLGVPYGDRDDWIRAEDGSWLHKDKHTDGGKTMRELGRTDYVPEKKNK